MKDQKAYVGITVTDKDMLQKTQGLQEIIIVVGHGPEAITQHLHQPC